MKNALAIFVFLFSTYTFASFDPDMAYECPNLATEEVQGKFEILQWADMEGILNPALVDEALSKATSCEHFEGIITDFAQQVEDLVNAWVQQQG